MHTVYAPASVCAVHFVLLIGVLRREQVRAVNPQPPTVQEDERPSKKRRDLHRYDVPRRDDGHCFEPNVQCKTFSASQLLDKVDHYISQRFIVFVWSPTSSEGHFRTQIVVFESDLPQFKRGLKTKQ